MRPFLLYIKVNTIIHTMLTLSTVVLPVTFRTSRICSTTCLPSLAGSGTSTCRVYAFRNITDNHSYFIQIIRLYNSIRTLVLFATFKFKDIQIHVHIIGDPVHMYFKTGWMVWSEQDCFLILLSRCSTLITSVMPLPLQ